MITPNIEDVRRIAGELESDERKRGGFGFELSFNDTEDIALPGLIVAVCIGLSFYIGSFAPLIYLAVIFGAGVVLGLAWAILEPVYEFLLENLEDIRESVAVIPGLLLGIGIFVSYLSQDKNVVESFVLAFIAFAMVSGFTQLAFWLLEWCVEYKIWALVLGVIFLGAVFG